MNDSHDRRRRHAGWSVICAVPTIVALLAVGGGYGGCGHDGPPDEVFGVASYQVVGTAIDIDTAEELGNATISLVAYGAFDGHYSDLSQPHTARTDDTGAFVLPKIEIIFGRYNEPPPHYIVLEAESGGRMACAAAMRRAIQRRDAGPDILEVGRVAFDFTAGPCSLTRPVYDPNTDTWAFQ